jgi:hypothetical protein
MNSAKETVFDLLRRLLAGERGQVPLLLAMLLERSSPLDSGDDHYRQILPPELADVRLSPETAEEIMAALCAEVSRNPDAALIAAISFTGTELATRTVAKVLTNPPHPLTIGEADAALSLVTKYLPQHLAEDSEFLPKADLERLVQVAKELQNIDETGTDTAERIGVKQHAGQLFERLTQLGIGGS